MSTHARSTRTTFTLQTPLAMNLCVHIQIDTPTLAHITWTKKTADTNAEESMTAANTLPPFAHQLQSEINHYFDNAKHEFAVQQNTISALAISADGTAFQRSVWQALTEIPVGSVVTYGDLAKKLKSSAQAVGNACRANPFPFFVPCHRVVSKTGLGGYAGETGEDSALIQVKLALLAHEGVN